MQTEKRILHLWDLDKAYAEADTKKVLNDARLGSSNVVQDIINELFASIDDDLNFVASCECGQYKGNYLEGFKCSICNTTVSHEYNTELKNKKFLVLSEKFPPVLHPVVFNILKKVLGKTKSVKGEKNKKAPILQALLDPNTYLPEELRIKIGGQGFRYFYENFDKIIHYFISEYKTNTKQDRINMLYLENVINKYRHMLFIRSLPVLDESLQPVMVTGKTKSIDSTAQYVIEPILNLNIIEFKMTKKDIIPDNYIDVNLWNIYTEYLNYLDRIVKAKLGEKEAHLRKHCTGSRTHLSSRTVIVPIVDHHVGDTIYLPWALAVNAYKYHIINKLSKQYGIKGIAAINAHNRALLQYDPLINEVLKDMIRNGLWVIIGRNPEYNWALYS